MQTKKIPKYKQCSADNSNVFNGLDIYNYYALLNSYYLSVSYYETCMYYMYYFYSYRSWYLYNCYNSFKSPWNVNHFLYANYAPRENSYYYYLTSHDVFTNLYTMNSNLNNAGYISPNVNHKIDCTGFNDLNFFTVNEVDVNKGGNSTSYLNLSEPELLSNKDSLVAELFSILSLNVCGLKSKLGCPEFTKLLQQYCIIGLQETKCDNLDFIDLPGYDVFMKNRHDIRTRRKSGGLALFVRKDISKYVKIIETDCKLVLWFTVSKSICKTDNDLLCGVIYIPPEYSEYSVEDPFLEIQNDYSNFIDKYDSFCLFGDFNSRTKSLDDYIILDTDFFESQNLEELCSEYNIEMSMFDSAVNVKRTRINSDKTSNNYGSQLLDFLKLNCLYILNGRTNMDIPGKTTCKGTSTVDYFICNSNCFKQIVSLNVLDFCPLMSDVHNPVELKLSFELSKCSVQMEKPTIKLWDSTKTNEFLNKIDVNEIQNINETLDNFEVNNNFTQENADIITETISSLFSNTSREIFGHTKIKDINNKKITNNSKPWFGPKCKKARKNFHTAKHLYKLRKNETTKENLKQNAKIYKGTLKQFYKNEKKESISKLRNLKGKDPRNYWKILNKKTKQNCEADLTDLYNFFKNVNFKNDESDEIIDEPNSDEVNESNEQINVPITDNEIEYAIKTLKNNKASGYDNVVNEHLKATFP
ncbi:uncharacterized protein LOC132715603 [Ruditapes philippinarum]|uniref:uncharacterized protein LOC132715603 n=1 Tax=Ruditapes philippinarum TaxID=129788 RepID=UPI00295A9A92|nr:uncharacterized protein LOC132715603 [Ruditapes philippinarum]